MEWVRRHLVGFGIGVVASFVAGCVAAYLDVDRLLRSSGDSITVHSTRDGASRFLAQEELTLALVGPETSEVVWVFDGAIVETGQHTIKHSFEPYANGNSPGGLRTVDAFYWDDGYGSATSTYVPVSIRGWLL